MILKDFELEIMRIREAINDMTLKGRHNASLVVYAIDKCDYILNEIRSIVKQKTEEVNKDGGEPNS